MELTTKADDQGWSPRSRLVEGEDLSTLASSPITSTDMLMACVPTHTNIQTNEQVNKQMALKLK